ncbi:RNA-binding RNA processing protein rpp1 [Marasmius crinis-equi]|uniref:RNA-binding RNA processing protein rpp1 n=1 Tax=Marasmius crinis-equi TaxID=585013 RepID=A0ABR3EL50_9AGAR
MFFDLNLPVSLPSSGQNSSKKGKGKAPVQEAQFSQAQLSAIDAQIDILIHFIGFNQTVQKKVDPKVHVNILDGLLSQLKKRDGIVFLKRLSIILDEDSEKGFGLINANIPYFNSYDLLSLIPTNQATLALACLTHSLPSQLTAHIISIPLTLPRPPFRLKHTLIRTAIKNGAVFEINYVGAIGGESEGILIEAGAADSTSVSAKRNWWASARELVRVIKGKGLIVSGGVVAQADFRAPRDVGNLVSLLGLSQDGAHDASTKNAKSVVLRAQTRKTYRAVLSEPVIVIPEGYYPNEPSQVPQLPSDEPVAPRTSTGTQPPPQNGKKRSREDDNPAATANSLAKGGEGGEKKKKKRKKDKDGNAN